MAGYPRSKKVSVTNSGVVKVVINRAKPIFSRAGIETIASGAESVTVTFPTSLPDSDFAVMCSIFNDADNVNLSQYLTVKGYTKSAGGFTVYLSAPTLTANYKLHWGIGELYNP